MRADAERPRVFCVRADDAPGGIARSPRPSGDHDGLTVGVLAGAPPAPVRRRAHRARRGAAAGVVADVDQATPSPCGPASHWSVAVPATPS